MEPDIVGNNKPKVSLLAWISFTLGCYGMLCYIFSFFNNGHGPSADIGVPPALLGFVLGLISVKQISRNPEQLKGIEIANASVVISMVAAILLILFPVF